MRGCVEYRDELFPDPRMGSLWCSRGIACDTGADEYDSPGCDSAASDESETDSGSDRAKECFLILKYKVETLETVFSGVVDRLFACIKLLIVAAVCSMKYLCYNGEFFVSVADAARFQTRVDYFRNIERAVQ